MIVSFADTELSADPREDIPEEFLNRRVPLLAKIHLSSSSVIDVYALLHCNVVDFSSITGMQLLRRYQASVTLTSEFPES